MIACVYFPHFADSLEQQPSRLFDETALSQIRAALADFSNCIEFTHTVQSVTFWLALGNGSQTELLDLGHRIGQRVAPAVSFTPSIGIAANKFTAQAAASNAKPPQPLIVLAGREATFLAPFPIETLPLDQENAQRLHRLGIRTLGQVAALPRTAMIARFGAAGRLWHQLSGGQDPRLLVPQPIEPSEQLTRQFDDPIADRTVVTNVLHDLIEQITARLQTQQKLCRRVVLQLQLADKSTFSQATKLRRPTAHPGRLLQICLELLAQGQLRAGITDIAVTVSDLIPAKGEQLALFLHQAPQTKRLFEALPHLTHRYGTACFFQAAIQDQMTLLPERRFRFYEVESR